MAVAVPDLGPILAGAGTGPADLDAPAGESAIPLALFPVRLETRFFGNELRVRVYPDKVHIDSHDPALSANELLWGRRYWELQWQAGSDDARLREAWRMLAGRLGPERAAWVARALTPTNPSARPGGTPKFPDLDPAKVARTPLVRLLPDRWVATAYTDGRALAVGIGREIKPDLAIGPNLEQDAPIDDEEPAVDQGMRWMVDFDSAEEVGMALRVTLPVPAVDVLLVVGASAGDRSDDVAAQLDAHHYADGLAFLPPESPTNNTAAGRTPYQTPDPQDDRSYAEEWLADDPAPGSHAALAKAAFGVDVFRHATAATETDEPAAGAMAAALWPTTWGYFLAQMIGFDGTGLTLAGREWARTHAVDHLRPGGPLPVLRIGRQPYGVLPVTSLDTWHDAVVDVGPLRDLLTRLRDAVWRPAWRRVPRVGLTDDASLDLKTVLEAGALSSSYRIHNLMGQHFLQHLRAFLGEDLEPFHVWRSLVELSTQQATRVGLNFEPALAHAAYEGVARTMTAPLVGDPSYIADLLAAAPDELAAIPTEAQPLLHVLLRHALLREYAEAGARALDAQDTALLRDTELVDLLPGTPPTPTWSWTRSQTAAGGTVGDLEADDPELRRYKEVLQTLSGLDAPTLERHVAQTLDATSHRLDAWVTSLATRRLSQMRAAQPTGLRIGGYGWVENLRPATPGPGATGVPDEPGPLVAPGNDPGFIHAPSLNQASAAALLRNAHLAHGGDADSPYAIDLTSARVRLAKHLFDGVRQGQPIGAVLGYTFERNLHEAGLDELIDDMRAVAPLPGASTPTGVRRLVVDGLALARKWQTDRDSVIAPTHPRHDRAAKVLDALEVAVDAAADAVNAEGAFQMVRGNVARAASSLEAVSNGEAPPPDLGFVRTPRTGVGLTHRVALFVDADAPDNPAGWADRASSPRALADPALDAWAGQLLGPADGVAANVEELSPDGVVTATRVVSLTSLGLTPIDLVWATGGVDGPPPEVVARVIAKAGATGRVDLSRAAGGFGDLIEVATRAQRLLAGARPLDGGDLLPPHAEPVRGEDLDEFQGRVVAAEEALKRARDVLRDALADGGDVREAMHGIAAFGVPGAVPTPGTGTETPQAQAVLTDVNRRLDAPPPEGEPLTRLLGRLHTVFGSGFVALPRFTAANADDLQQSLADPTLGGDDPLAPYTWLQRMERVRPPLARMTRPLNHAQIARRAGGLDVQVAQVPHVPRQRWVALDQPEGTTPVDGAASLLLQSAPSRFDRPLCGLLVDEWTELVPSRKETTGIAFQYDPPDAAAPQAILLAVPAVQGEPWTLRSLNRVLLETLDLTRLRAVDPALLGDVAHFLPATYLAFNAHGDAVSSDLNLLAPEA